MNRRTKLKFIQLMLIIFCWLIIGFLITAYDYFVLHTQYSSGPTPEYSFLISLALNLGAAFTGALLGGSFLVFYVNVKYQDKPYGYTILAVSISFILIIAFISTIIAIITLPGRTGKPLVDSILQADFSNFFLDINRTLKNTIIWSVVVAVTQLLLQMNSKFGYGVFWNIIRGKYNTPKQEERIFMSLDLNSSTQLAENLGDEKYHELLKDFFADITNPILDNNGDIYQYVGDEVIIAWEYVDENSVNQSVKCFFDMKNSIDKRKENYLQRYGILPTFKAGIHSGKVIVGEVGIIKRDITYSGDVMNTTSRLRDKCKEFNVEIIATADVFDELSLKNYATKKLGFIKLRGKDKEVLLSTLVIA